MTKSDIREGAIFCIPLWNGRKAVGKMLHVSNIWKKRIKIAVYKRYLDTYDYMNGFPKGKEAFLEPRMFIVSDEVKKDMPWELIDCMPLDHDELEMSCFISYPFLYQQDTVIRDSTPFDYIQYPNDGIDFCASVTSLADEIIAYKNGCSPEEGGFALDPIEIRIGDILAIPLRNRLFVPAKVLYVSKYPFKYQKALLAVFKAPLKSPKMPDNYPGRFNSTLRYVHAAHLKDGRWPRIGHQEVYPEETNLALHVDSGYLFMGDELLRKASHEEHNGMLTNSIVWLAGWLEKEVHEWFGCPPRHISDSAISNPLETDGLWLKSSEWMAQLIRSRSWAMTQKALEFAIKADYLELDECYEALAAGEVVAAAMGKPEKSLPAEAKDWAAKHRATIDSDLIKLAAKALARTRKNSELSEEVAESIVLAPWKNRMASLAKRLKTGGKLK